MADSDLAALLCSRLCHDLVSPVGAIQNGLEVLGDESGADMRDQVVELLASSTRQASDRLRFYRLAFGAGGAFGDVVDTAEAHSAVAGLLVGSRVTLDWSVRASRAEKRLMKGLLNLVLVGYECIIRDGTLSVALDGQGTAESLRVSAAAPRLNVQDSLRGALQGRKSADDLDPKTAPALLAADIFSAQGLMPVMEEDADGAGGVVHLRLKAS
ncbi:histidine phosphotransferase family protein [Yunchengibacter salinarum]|uniref:histidine phosphotransferase family protein n=1 Tax=Yunchengibacter salinarum TaxID=3133399 RepID=UPI0035B68DE9